MNEHSEIDAASIAHAPVPPEFARHFKQSPLTDPWEPLYSCVRNNCVVIGLQLTAAHTNSRGFAHGGLIAALADNAMGLSCARHKEGDAGGGVTVGINIDYLSVARVGDWLEFRTEVTKVGRTLSFAACRVVTADRAIAHATASFASSAR